MVSTQRQNLNDEWNGLTNYQGAQEFMDISRQQLGQDVTVEQAARAYANEYVPYLNTLLGEDDEPVDIEDACGSLVAYLEATRGEEWDSYDGADGVIAFGGSDGDEASWDEAEFQRSVESQHE